jgi:hypothetical protein
MSLVSISIPAVAVNALTIGKKNKSLKAPHQLRCKQSLILCHFYIFIIVLQEQDVKCIFCLKLSEANI